MISWLSQKRRQLGCFLMGHWYDNTLGVTEGFPDKRRFHCLYCNRRMPGTETYTDET